MALETEGADTGGAADLLGGGGDAGAGTGDGGQGGGQASGEGGDGGSGGDGFVAPEWYGNVSAEAKDGDTSSNRDWLQARGHKDLDGLVKSARDFERQARDKAGIKLPGEDAKPEEVAAFRAAIGVPEKVEDYEVRPIENGQFDPSRAEGPDNLKHVPLNEPLVGFLRESALKHGTPKAAFEGQVADFIQYQLEEAEGERQRLDGEAAAWVKEQGGKKDEQVAHIDAAARSLGLSRADMGWFRTMPGGPGRALGLLAKLGSGMAEDVMITGGKGRFGLSGAEAQSELDKLKGDADFQKKVMVAGSPERVRWDRLNKIAAEARAAADERGEKFGGDS